MAQDLADTLPAHIDEVVATIRGDPVEYLRDIHDP